MKLLLRDIREKKREIFIKLAKLEATLRCMDRNTKAYNAILSEYMKLMGESYQLGREAYRRFPRARKEIEALNKYIYKHGSVLKSMDAEEMNEYLYGEKDGK